MARIERFEDIQAWQKARDLTNAVYAFTENGRLGQDYRLRDQMTAAAVSVMANIAEGFDAGSNAEFIRFLRYARRSASEVQSHLYVAFDRSYITDDQFKVAYTIANETKALIGGFTRYLQNTTK